MPRFLLVRAADHVVLGVSWSGLKPSEGTGASGIPVLTAINDGARVVLTFSPQHLAEETSMAVSDAPAAAAPVSLPVAAILSGPSRLAFRMRRGDTLVPTVEGILQALRRRELVQPASPPQADDTAVELPWRLVVAPKARAKDLDVVPIHPATPETTAGVDGMWRTRIVAEPLAGSGSTVQSQPPIVPPVDAQLDLIAVDGGLAADGDPGFGIPLPRSDRRSVFTEASRRPAQATRLELSALGGTLDAVGTWDNFQWEHLAVLGRDIRVRTLAKGALYPLGHRAEYHRFIERIFDPVAGNAAVLRSLHVLTVTEPVRRPPADGASRRAFPFDDVEITTTSFPNLGEAVWQTHRIPGGGDIDTHFWPKTTTGQDVRFPIRCASPTGPVEFRVPLLFVADRSPGFASLTDPGLAAKLKGVYGNKRVPLPGRQLDLARAATRQNGDVHEVHSITIEGSAHPTGFRPRLSALEVALPALRSLLGDDRARQVRFADAFVRNGETENVLLEVAGDAIDLNFVGRSDRSGGLVAPRYKADALSRTLGPVNLRAQPNPPTGPVNPSTLFPGDATLLGFALRDLVTQLKAPPKITSALQPGRPPEVQMKWNDVKLKSRAPFEATAESTLGLTVTSTPIRTKTTCTISNFALVLPSADDPLLKLNFGHVTFTQVSGQPQPQEVNGVTVDVSGVDANFLGELQLLEELQSRVDLAGADRYLDVTPTGVTVRYTLALDRVPAGAFVMRNLLLRAGITIPFDGQPVTVSLGFASRENPFALTVLMFGGGGYIDILIDHTGLRRFEAALEFGALVEVNFLVARGEVYALGGIRFTLANGSVSLTGYLRIGGCVEILGLVSVAVELSIALAYQSDKKALVGRATLVIEIDLTLWSETVELDSGEWVLTGGTAPAAQQRRAFAAAGGPPPPPEPPPPAEAGLADPGLARWRQYRAAFAQPTVREPQ